MNKFEEKFNKIEMKTAFLQHCYGYNDYRTLRLRKKLELYKKVMKMSHEEVANQLVYSAGEIQKFKSGYYNHNTGVDENRKLIKVLTERIKAENQEAKKTNKDSVGCLVEIGSSFDNSSGGMEC